MSRNIKQRTISCIPEFSIFKPKGILNKNTEVIHLSLDELEAIRLIDYQCLYHNDAANKMNVSRATIGRIVNDARKKISDALLNGKILKIGGGEVHLNRMNDGNCVFCTINNDKIERNDLSEKCKICSTLKQ